MGHTRGADVDGGPVTDPLDAWYRAALIETMRVCPEWHQTKDERADAQARVDALAAHSQPGDSVPETVDGSAA